MRRSLILLVSLLWLLPAAEIAHAADPAQTQEEHGQTESHDAPPAHDVGTEHGNVENPLIHGDEQADEHHAAEGHDGGHGEAHGEHLELPHLIMLLRNFGPLAHNETFVHYSHLFENFFFAALAGLVLVFLARKVYANRQLLPGRLQSAFEILVEQILSITVTMMGEKDGRKYAPFILTIFAYILFMNYSVLVPLGKSATATLINNASIAICVFLYVQYTGIRRNGLGGYLHHLAGSPKDAIGWGMSVLMFPLEVLGEFIKPMSLSLRLFGNIFGEDTLLAVFAVLGVVVVGLFPGGEGLWVGVPLHVPFFVLSMLLGMIQALVFSLLTTVYIALMLPHGEHHGEDHAHAH
jgi:F-type H+-transporting ATPase subunit a